MLAMVSVTEGIILGVLAVVVLMLISLRTIVLRVEARLNKMEQSADNQSTRASKPASEDSQDSAFDQFLAEDPQRLAMTKSEQFAAYREWRKEKGMNWSS